MNTSKNSDKDSESISQKPYFNPDFKKLAPYLILMISLWIIFSIVMSASLMNNSPKIMLIMRTAFCLLIIYGLYLKFIKNNLSYDSFIPIVILCGFILRTGYSLCNSYTIRQHDIGDFSNNMQGHLNYIYYIYTFHKLPDQNIWQYYHPPLYHALSAFVLYIYHLLSGRPAADIIDFIKIVPCFASCAVILIVNNILDTLNIKNIAKLACISIVAFLPNYFLVSGRINNDSLSFTFFMLALLFTLMWYQSEKLSHLILTGIAIGLGMMTKLSVGIIALFTGALMIYKLFVHFRKKEYSSTIINYIVFSAICFPLGLWHSIHQYIKFGQPFGYVLKLSESITSIWRGDNSFMERFIIFPFKAFNASPYNDPNSDVNSMVYLIRGAIFGEFNFANKITNAFILDKLNFILIIISIIFLIYVLTKGKNYSPIKRYGMASIWFITMLSYYYFNIKYPNSCTMDFRYVMASVFCGAYYIGLGLEMLTAEPITSSKKSVSSKKTNSKNKSSKNRKNAKIITVYTTPKTQKYISISVLIIIAAFALAGISYFSF